MEGFPPLEDDISVPVISVPVNALSIIFQLLLDTFPSSMAFNGGRAVVVAVVAAVVAGGGGGGRGYQCVCVCARAYVSRRCYLRAHRLHATNTAREHTHAPARTRNNNCTTSPTHPHTTLAVRLHRIYP